MADNNTKITKGVTIKENSTTPKEIEIIPGGSVSTKTTVQGSQTTDVVITLPNATDTLVGKATTDTLTNKTIDANGTGNSISNLEVADLASGVLNVSTTLAGATDLQLPSALAVKTYVDDGLAAQDAASEISYDGTASGLVATNVQDAIDEVEARVDTTESDIFNHITNGSGAHPSSAISYVNTVSGLTAVEVQSAIDELDGLVDTNTTGLSNHLSDTTDAHDASAISNIPSGNLAATDVQAALNELQSDIDTRATSSALAAHTGASTGVHGVTGAVVGTTDTQVLTNKDIDGGTASNTSRITLPKASKATLDALTRKEGAIVYASDLDKVYYDDGSTLQEVGSGSGSGGAVNFITNGDAESGTTGWVRYNDGGSRPTDGTGGSLSSSVTFGTTSSNPLSGTSSFLFSKAAGNFQGYGVSYDFTIDNARKAKVLKVEFDYIDLTGGFVAGSSTTDSSIIVYLYDVTNSVLIEPSTFKLYSSSTTIPDKYQGYFQTSSNSTSYRLIFHIASTSTTGFDLKIDNISVSPSQYVYGTPITDWQSYVPTLSWVANVSSNGAFWRRVGDSLEVQGNLTLSGAPTAADLSISIPSGLTINTSKINGGISNKDSFGTASILDSGNRFYVAEIVSGTTTSVIVNHTESGNFGTVNATNPVTFGASDAVGYRFSVPITGWSSSVQVSDGYDGRVIAASAYGTPTGTINTSDNVIVWGAASVKLDKTAAYNSSTGLFTVQAAGEYEVIATPRFGFTAAGSKYVNATIAFAGSISETIITTARPPSDAVDIMPTVSAIRTLKAGDTIGIYSNTNATSPTHGIGQMSIKKLSGSATMVASPTVSALYTGAPPTGTLGAAYNIVTFGTKVKDSHGSYSSGSYTVSQSGQYDISAQLAVTGTFSAGKVVECAIFIDGVIKYRRYTEMYGATTNSVSANVAVHSIPLIAGQVVTIRSYTDATAPSYSSNATENFFSINRSGGY